ncbi:FadR/GntR family transcriptional regulator [Variovorax sp. PBL-E5]|uniref:FadR/GntR family transcriptional regulator n=1 Tax=Variovorax sp. PBL-E5 TaxID=434014 RepID=UPI0013197175|nr:FCD domain-containing protein [Variovorax sp. PBL-E5]VTU30688.1 Putative L-lactate dehydrogenase operon regulatory protein [Variovorax sp. PBL-E5]
MPQTQQSRTRAALRFKPVMGTRPADEIQAQIRALLASHRLKAGDRLPSERDLSEQFSVSRNSVRQALRSLVDSGLLEMKKGAAGGAFIRDGGGDAVLAGISDLYSLGTIQPEHLTEVRLLIGVEVVRLACQRCTPEEVDAIEQNVVLAEQAAKENDFARRTAINLEFHRMLARMTRNPLLITLTDAVTAITAKFVNEVGPTSNRSVMPLRRQLLGHLRAREADAAAQKMRNHLLRLQKIYLAQIAG